MNGPEPCPDENRLVALVEGRLAAAELGALETHIASCDACTSVLDELGAVLAPEPAKEAAVREVGRYRLLHVLGRGGMGVVYAAYDPELRRKVALKLLRPDLGAGTSATARARLLREARLLATLSHPNVVGVHDAGVAGDQVFLACELVEGRSLREWQRDAEPAWRRVAAVYAQAARGLAAAHDAGLVHRDVKPDNVLIGDDGRVRVGDFGLATAEDGARDEHSLEQSPATLSTATGVVLGTPAYMAPEQYAGDVADAQSDQFSFCVALGEALIGERPGVGASVGDLRVAETRNRRALAPRALLRLVERGLRARPRERHRDMQTIARTLDALAANGARLGTRAWQGMLAFGVAGAAVVVGIRLSQPGAGPDVQLSSSGSGAFAHEAAPAPNAPANAASGQDEREARTGVETRAGRSASDDAQPELTERGGGLATASRSELPSSDSAALAGVSAAVNAPFGALDDDARHDLISAQRAAQIEDGPACLAALDTAVARERALAAHPTFAEQRGRCEMLVGRCAAGRARLAALFGAELAGDALEQAIDARATPACKSHGPTERDRLRALLVEAASAAQARDVPRCRAADAALRQATGERGAPAELALGVAEALSQLSRCLVAAKDCDAAFTTFAALYEPKHGPLAAPLDAESLRRMFESTYPECKR